MSLDLYLQTECDCCKHIEEHWHGNITHNLTEMAAECNLYAVLWRPDENGMYKASDIVGELQSGIKELQGNPDKYEHYNPENGWGNYDNLLNFAIDCLAACRKHPGASVVACR